MFYSDQITYYVVPYGLYGGGEIYLENHIKQGTFKNVHLLFFYDNPLKQQMVGFSPCTVFRHLALVEKFLISIEARYVAFHNSLRAYRMLQRVRKAIGTHIIEVVHSNLKWDDSMHFSNRADIGTIIAVSDAVAQEMGLTDYEVIPPIVDASRFNIPRRLSEKIIVGTVARFAPYKNLTRIIDIAKHTDDDFHFIIVGADGGTMKDVRQRITTEGLSEKIAIKPFTPRIEEEYAGFDVFLLTSIEEGRPLVIEEAGAAGLPVVASGSGGIREQMAGRDGHVFSLDDADEDIAQQVMAWGRKSRKRAVKRQIFHDGKGRAVAAGCPLNKTGKNIYLRPSHPIQPIDNYMPLVSVYIAAYNHGRFLPQAIESALTQTYPRVEVCICDDGSTDNTLEILETRYKENERVRWVTQENSGVHVASGKAVALCRGELLAQLDADDWFEPTAMAEVVQVFQKNPAIGLVYTGHREVDENGRVIKTFMSDQYDRNRMFLGMIVGHLKVFKRELYDMTDGFTADQAQDYDISMKVSDYAQCYRYERILYNYRKHDNSLTAKDHNIQTVAATSIIDKTLKRQGLPYNVLPSFPESFVRQLFFDRETFDATTISVIIVNHGPFAKLSNVLSSLHCQTHLPKEIIVIDAGHHAHQNDRASQEKYLPKAGTTQYRIVNCPDNQNTGAVIGQVLLEAVGDYIAFQNPGWVSTPNRLQAQLMALTRLHKLYLFSGDSAPVPQGAVLYNKVLSSGMRLNMNDVIGGSLMVSKRVATVCYTGNLLYDVLRRYGDNSVMVVNQQLMYPV